MTRYFEKKEDSFQYPFIARKESWKKFTKYRKAGHWNQTDDHLITHERKTLNNSYKMVKKKKIVNYWSSVKGVRMIRWA